MLVLSTLSALLEQLLTPSLHTAILSTPQGHLVAFAGEQLPVSEDRLRILVGLSSEVWRQDAVQTGDNSESGSEETSEEGDGKTDDQVGMLECEVRRWLVPNPSVLTIPPQLGRLLVLPIYAISPEDTPTPDGGEPQPILLLSLNGVIDEPWGLMHTKVRDPDKAPTFRSERITCRQGL